MGEACRNNQMTYDRHIVNHTACSAPSRNRPAASDRPATAGRAPALLAAALGSRPWGTIRTVGGPDQSGGAPEQPTWTFLTNHGHVLVCIAGDPGIRGRDIAARVGITERAAQAIVADLVAEGYVTRTRVGRRNHYEINRDRPLRHPVEQPHRIGELLELVAGLDAPRRRLRPASRTGAVRPPQSELPDRDGRAALDGADSQPTVGPRRS